MEYWIVYVNTNAGAAPTVGAGWFSTSTQRAS